MMTVQIGSYYFTAFRYAGRYFSLPFRYRR